MFDNATQLWLAAHQLVGSGLASEPRPERPERRARLDLAAADLAGDLDPQHFGDVGPPWRLPPDVPAAHRHVVGVHHDARLGDQPEVAAADFGADPEHGRGDDGLGEVEHHRPAGHLYFHALRHDPAAVPLGVAAAAVDADQILRLGGGPGERRRAGRWQVHDEFGELTVGAGTQRQLQPLVKLFRGQAAVTGRHTELLNDLVPVVV